MRWEREGKTVRVDRGLYLPAAEADQDHLAEAAAGLRHSNGVIGLTTDNVHVRPSSLKRMSTLRGKITYRNAMNCMADHDVSSSALAARSSQLSKGATPLLDCN